MSRPAPRLVTLAGCALLAAACTGGGTPKASSASSNRSGTPNASNAPNTATTPTAPVTGTTTIGPAPTGAASGGVAVTESDDGIVGMDGIAPRPGDTVTFQIANGGARQHDFVLTGPDHARVAATGPLAPGGAASVTVTFTKQGDYAYASDLPGDAAMSGTFTVSP